MFSGQPRDKLQVYNLWLNGGLGAVTVVAAALAYYAIVQPLNVQAESVRAEARVHEALIQHATEITKTNQSLANQVSEAQRVAKELATRIPSAPRESDFLSQICHLANGTGLEVSDYHPGAIDARENHHEMEVRISARGEYEAVCRFLKQIDEVPRLCRLVQLQLGTQDKESDLVVDMVFKIYFAPPTSAEVALEGK